ncbi:YesL family protein [Micromonospora sp. NPDC005707]|uniref:YesL family protein n=1 Tax=Micromonospora sp. NPDC005707 TaxID=3157050 RepID=UPI0034083EB2
MSDVVRARRQFGDGPLSRAAALIYILLVVELLLLVTTAPGLVALALLDRDVSNLPLVAACAVPLGPALSAAFYTLHHQRLDLTDLRPARVFWRGYRTNLRDALLIWVPLLLWLTVIAVNLAHLSAAALPRWWAVPLVLVGAGAALVGLNALVITSLFAFRVRDVIRLARFFVLRTPVGTLGVAGLLAAAAALVLVTSEALLVALGAVLVLALLRGSDPMIAMIRNEFTA